MHLFGFDISVVRKAASVRTSEAVGLSPISGGRGWFPIVREPYAGAWQKNDELVVSDVLAYGPVFACVTLIAESISKLGLRLMAQDADSGIWEETSNPAFSPLLRKPNRYQTRIKFVEDWIRSKLVWGNTYVLKERDARGVVVALYVLNPSRVRPLIAPDGGVYYQLGNDLLAEIDTSRTVPASEIIHDTMICLYHPLVGVSPIYACGMTASTGIAMQATSKALFTNGSQPPGILLVPGNITQEQVAAANDAWKSRVSGEIAVLPNGMKYEPLAVNAVDAELIKQLQWTGEDVARCYHVPAYLINIGTAPYGNYAPLMQMFYSDALQPLIANFEAVYEDGIGLLTPINGTQYGVEFDVDDLLWMDHEMRAKVAGDAIQHGALSPNEARADYFGKPPVEGGETPYLQEQNWPLKLLAGRELPTRAPTPPAPPPGPSDQPPPAKDLEPAALRAALELALGLAA